MKFTDLKIALNKVDNYINTTVLAIIILLIFMSLYVLISEITYNNFTEEIINLNKLGFTAHIRSILMMGLGLALLTLISTVVFDDKKNKDVFIIFSKKLFYVLISTVLVLLVPISFIELLVSNQIVGILLLVTAGYLLINFITAIILLLITLTNSCRHKI